MMMSSSQKAKPLSLWKVVVHKQCRYKKTLWMDCTEYGVHAARNTFLHPEALSLTPSMMHLKKFHLDQYFIKL